ncbi:MAG: sugar ABC transporter permease [Maritimibacter sp.]|jgi:putative multiple sugar transport system permease protein
MGDTVQDTTSATSPAGAENKITIGSYLRANLREYGLLFALIIVMVSFQVMTSGILMKPLNITNLVLQNSYIVIMAIGMLLVIVSGNIDLSVGSIVGFVGALAAVLMVSMEMPVLPAAAICLITGAIIGAAQGYWIAYHKIPSFIVTLAGMLVFRGLTLALLHGQSIGPFPVVFQRLSSGFIPDIAPIGGMHGLTLILGAVISIYLVWSSFRARVAQSRIAAPDEPMSVFMLKNALILVSINYFTYLMATYRGLPNVLIVMAILIAVYTFISSRTTIGRRIYALGGNEKAAKLSGVKTERLIFLTYANMGLMAALAGLVFAARLNSASPKAGVAFELDVIAAVFIGGASMSGGVGRVVGAVIGAFLMGVMNNGMSIMSVGIDYQQVIKGLVLLAAVIFDVYNKKKGA